MIQAVLDKRLNLHKHFFWTLHQVFGSAPKYPLKASSSTY
jgi:hypothetical protein